MLFNKVPVSLRAIVYQNNSSHQLLNYNARRLVQNWPEAPPNVMAFMPPNIEDRLLPQLPSIPIHFPDVALPYKHPRHNIDMRGPETIHNQLIYRQYGIIALGGGALTGVHLDNLRSKINLFMNPERFFAVWRVDPPWKPVSKKPQGKKLGGGKGKVHHYETPIRAGRIIIEVGGIGDFGEIKRVLTSEAKKLPFYAMPITQEILDNIKMEKERIDANNCNPFEYRDLLRRNFSNSQLKITPKDLKWGGTYF